MNDTGVTTLEQVRCFLDGAVDMEIAIASKADRYQWIQETLIRFHYRDLGRSDRGLLKRYLETLSGYSRSQITRLIRQYQTRAKLQNRQRTTKGFKSIYSNEDVRLLAEMDQRHDTLSGPATKKLCERAYERYGQSEYQRLATISVSHLYNLRQSRAYLNQRRHVEKTRRRQVNIGQRRKPQPNGKPGYIRIDTVHQGDWDGLKGVYHVNAVDEVTQFEVVCSVEKISEAYLIPVLEDLLSQFPFVIHNFHSDNGSEYINKRVAALLEKLHIKFTKSRSRQTNDNALAESKNAAVVRKVLGYIHIPQKYAPLLNEFHRCHLNPYVNYHRPCFFPLVTTDEKNGKQLKRYPYKAMMTPFDKLSSLSNPGQYLKEHITLQQLNDQANAMNDNAAVDALNEAKQLLFNTIFEQDKHVA